MTTPCDVEVEISCVGCSTVGSPANGQCNQGDDATQLRFRYNAAGSCAASTTTGSRFKCEDEVATRPATVFIRAEGKDDMFFQGEVSEGEEFVINIAEDEGDVDIEIFSDSSANTLLQDLRVDLDCGDFEESGLEVLATFGALTLTGFTNAALGTNDLNQDVTITYTITNDGVLDMILQNATRNSAFAGSQELVTADQTLPARESISFQDQTVTIDATAQAGQAFAFSFAAAGVGSVSQVGCADSDTFSFTVPT